MTLGEKIRQLRRDQGMSQQALSDKLGVTAQAVSKWENGTSFPDISMLPSLASIFGVQIDDLFEYSRDKQFEKISNMIELKPNISNKEFADAESFLLREIERNPEDHESVSMLADLYCTQAFNHQLLKDYVGRPSPLYYAERMSHKYGCRLYLKREDLNHTGAHKINNTIGQILLAKRMGKTRIIAETGAGQHGVATATVCALMNMQCEIFMGATDVERQHTNVERMKMLGATVHPVRTGNMTLSDACSEAIRDWCCHPSDTFYIVGSTMGPHPYPDLVARMQSVISEEIKQQLQEKEGRDYPDYLVACIGGGSNAAGTIYHYVDDERVRIVLAEAGGDGYNTDRTAATFHRGTTGILHGAKMLVMQNEDGQIQEAFTISACLTGFQFFEQRGEVAVIRQLCLVD